MAGHHDFDYLTSREYDLELREKMRPEDSDVEFSDDEEDDERDPGPSYLEETEQEILEWRPAHWWIPSHNDLVAITQILPPWPPNPDRYAIPDDGVLLKTHFSAAAVAIRFLERLTPNLCSHIRNMVIQEDHPA
jgi:hypothetical protein